MDSSAVATIAFTASSSRELSGIRSESSPGDCAAPTSSRQYVSSPRRAACKIAETAAQTISSPYSAAAACPEAKIEDSRERLSR